MSLTLSIGRGSIVQCNQSGKKDLSHHFDGSSWCKLYEPGGQQSILNILALINYPEPTRKNTTRPNEYARQSGWCRGVTEYKSQLSGRYQTVGLLLTNQSRAAHFHRGTFTTRCASLLCITLLNRGTALWYGNRGKKIPVHPCSGPILYSSIFVL